MGKPKDITGKRFNRLVALRLVKIMNSHSLWEFQCDCGNTIISQARYAADGGRNSCGCLWRERQANRKCKHGDAKKGKTNPLYFVYHGMIQRCTNPKTVNFKWYGNRGIKVLWDSYEQFASDMGPTYKRGLTIDRINPNGNYCKENCRWATWTEQLRNKRIHHAYGY